MQAFKLYFKIFKKAGLASTIMYVVMFSTLCILFTQIGSSNPNKAFEIDKRQVAIINNDNSKFSDELENYIKQNTKVVKIDTSDKGIKDALFFRKAEYILTIPKGYGDAFFTENRMTLGTKTLPDSMSSTFIDLMVNKYLTTFDIYHNGAGNMSFDEIVSNVNKDLKVQAEAKMQGKDSNLNRSSISYYFNFACYPILCILILSVSMVLNSVNQKDIKRRNLCSPINSTKFSLQIFFGNVTLMFAVFMLFGLYSLLLYRKTVFTAMGLWYLVNLLIISLVALTLSFLIGNIADKKAINPICNTVALAFAFLGGAFVPQELLSQSVKNFAVINPVFWFIKANNKIGIVSEYNWSSLKSVVFYMGIEIAFALAFLSIALVIIKQRRTKA